MGELRTIKSLRSFRTYADRFLSTVAISYGANGERNGLWRVEDMPGRANEGGETRRVAVLGSALKGAGRCVVSFCMLCTSCDKMSNHSAIFRGRYLEGGMWGRGCPRMCDIPIHCCRIPAFDADRSTPKELIWRTSFLFSSFQVRSPTTSSHLTSSRGTRPQRRHYRCVSILLRCARK